MKTAVINPPFMNGKFSRTSRSPAINKSGTLYWPFWLAHGVGTLEEAGHEVLFLDCPATGINHSVLLEKVIEYDPGLIVIDTSAPSINSDLRIASEMKEKLPNAVLLLVGTHAGALPEECLHIAPLIDGVAVGEYDRTLPEAAAAIESGDGLTTVPGLVLRIDGVVMQTPVRNMIENLDSLPFLADVYRKHLKPENYFFAAARYPSIMTITSRGCPYKCSFCVWPQVMHRGRYTVRSPEHIAEEFKLIAEYFPKVQEVVIEDDTFSIDNKRVESVSNALIEINNKLPWTANVRANLSLNAMKKMKQAGCRLIIVGYETGSQEILNNVSKGTTIEQNMEFAERARKTKLLVHGCFMAGNPGETPRTLEETYRMAVRLAPDTAQFFPIMVYPGTKLYDEYRAAGFMKADSFDEWVTPEGLHNCVVNLPGLSAEKLVAWCYEARRRFYLRPSYLFYKAMQSLLHPLTEGRRTLRAFGTFRKHLFRKSE